MSYSSRSYSVVDFARGSVRAQTLRNITAWLGVLLGVVLLPTLVSAQAVSDSDRAALAEPWRGSWIGGGFRYEATMSLRVGGSGDVEGSIHWTLRESPREPEASKIGMTGVEHVRGQFRADVGLLVLEGYRKDDPNSIIGLDKYRLVMSEVRKTMGGITHHHGPWDGRFFLMR